jgi:hypothetical protein
MNTGESEADARRFRSSIFSHKYLLTLVIHLRNRSKLTDFSFFALFTPHSIDRGTDPNMRIGSAINHLIDIRYQGKGGWRKSAHLEYSCLGYKEIRHLDP